MKREIVTLCGSTKFKKEYEEMRLKFALEGKVVLSVGCYMHHDGIPITSEQKLRLDRLHMDKIKMSDSIFVIDVSEYIGESTRREIRYASMLGRKISYYSKMR